MKNTQWVVVSLGVILALACAQGAQAVTYYAAASSSNAGNCGAAQTVTTPIQGMRGGVACLSSGDTLILLSGVYTDDNMLEIIPSGRGPSANTVVRAQISRGAIIRPLAPSAGGANTNPIRRMKHTSYVTIQGLVFDAINVHGGGGDAGRNLIELEDDSPFITIDDCEFKNIIYGQVVESIGIAVAGAPDLTVRRSSFHDIIQGCRPNCEGTANAIYWSGPRGLLEYSEFYNIGNYALHHFNINSDYAPLYAGGTTIRYNTFRNIGWTNLIASRGSVFLVHNNIFIDMDGPGVYLGYFGDGSNTRILNNTFYRTGLLYGGGCIQSGSGANGEVRNNICCSSIPSSMITDATGGYLQTGNLTGTDPQFANVAAHDFSLRSGSPAIDFGINVGLPYQGRAPDAGAKEFGSTPRSAPLPAPTNLIGFMVK